MKLSKEGKELIHKYEQFRNHPYIDAVGVPTIGWGNTYYPNGKAVTMNDKPLTRKEADELFNTIVQGFESAVNKHVNKWLEQPQFDALVSFAYNVGVGNFRSSTLLKVINEDPNNYEEIERQFKRWNKGRVNGKLKELRGLTKRRNEEFYLYKKCA